MATFKGMRFCRECDNMLQPKEQKTADDQDIGRLIYDCRICGYFEKAKAGDEADHCVYRSSENNNSSGNSSGTGGEAQKFFFHVDKECVKDPTLSRRKDLQCKKCGHNEAVTFMNPTKDRMNLIFVCTKCTYYWRKEKPAEGQ